MWGTFLSNYRYFSYQPSCLLLLLKVYKINYRKENISVGGNEQRRDTFFWISSIETWMKLFRLECFALLYQVSLSFYGFYFIRGSADSFYKELFLQKLLLTESGIYWNCQKQYLDRIESNSSVCKIYCPKKHIRFEVGGLDK